MIDMKHLPVNDECGHRFHTGFFGGRDSGFFCAQMYDFDIVFRRIKCMDELLLCGNTDRATGVIKCGLFLTHWNSPENHFLACVLTGRRLSVDKDGVQLFGLIALLMIRAVKPQLCVAKWCIYKITVMRQRLGDVGIRLEKSA